MTAGPFKERKQKPKPRAPAAGPAPAPMAGTDAHQKMMVGRRKAVKEYNHSVTKALLAMFGPQQMPPEVAAAFKQYGAKAASAAMQEWLIGASLELISKVEGEVLGIFEGAIEQRKLQVQFAEHFDSYGGIGAIVTRLQLLEQKNGIPLSDENSLVWDEPRDG